MKLTTNLLDDIFANHDQMFISQFKMLLGTCMYSYTNPKIENIIHTAYTHTEIK